MKKTLRLFFLLLIFYQVSFFAIAQHGVNYDDVGVVVNMNDNGSQQIANYFAAKRHIPAANLIPVHTTSAEEIDSVAFADYASQIQNYLDANDPNRLLNYLVTTKGCPLKVLRSNPDCNACVENELMLLPPAYNSYTGNCSSNSDIVGGNFLENPYYHQTQNFFKAGYEIYLVTRLDAYTVPGVLDLIDRSGANTYVDKDSVLFVLDLATNRTGFFLNTAMTIAADTLTARGWHLNLNTDSVFVTNQKNVLGYTSWGSNDSSADHYTQHAMTHNTWANGSIAETCVSTGGRSFQPGTTYGQSLVADLLAEGVTGTKGYVYEPFVIAIAPADVLFDRYTDLLPDGSPKYNLAESYYAASRMIGWMDVVIGDPKTSITTNRSLANAIPEVKNVPFRLFPNPAADEIRISAGDLQPERVSIYNMNGQLLISQKQPSGAMDIRSLAKGIYMVEIISGKEAAKIRLVRI